MDFSAPPELRDRINELAYEQGVDRNAYMGIVFRALVRGDISVNCRMGRTLIEAKK